MICESNTRVHTFINANITRKRSKRFTAALVVLIAGTSLLALPSSPSMAGMGEKGASKGGMQSSSHTSQARKIKSGSQGAARKASAPAPRVSASNSSIKRSTGMNTVSSNSVRLTTSTNSQNLVQSAANSGQSRTSKSNKNRRLNRVIATGVAGAANYGDDNSLEFFTSFGRYDSNGVFFVRFKDENGNVSYKQQASANREGANVKLVKGSNIIKTDTEKSYLVEGEYGSTGGNASGSFIRVTKGAKMIDILGSSRSSGSGEEQYSANSFNIINAPKGGLSEAYSQHLGGMVLIAGQVDYTLEHSHAHKKSSSLIGSGNLAVKHATGSIIPIKVESGGMVEIAGSGGLKNLRVKHKHKARHTQNTRHVHKMDLAIPTENPKVIMLKGNY